MPELKNKEAELTTKPVKKAASKATAKRTSAKQASTKKVASTKKATAKANDKTEQVVDLPASDENQNTEQPAQEPVTKSCSKGLSKWIVRNNMSLAFTSYQSGRVYFVGADPEGRVSFHERVFQRAMGIVGNEQRIYMGGLYQVWRFENVLQAGQVANKMFDKCYVPRNAQFTGEIDIHELGIQKDGTIVFVNTKYNCLAVPSITHSFKAIWKPEFISKLVPEDRCHLNGLAMVDSKPKYVTAVCKSDTIDGWRERRHDGGIIIDIETNEIVCEGLSMPHSPRWHEGKLWVLNSGTGYLGYVDFEQKKFVPHTFVPGFARGLGLHGNFAVVGLSKPRYERFEGLDLDKALADKDSTAWCGLQIINLTTGSVEEWIRLDGPISELFDLTLLPNVRCPMAIGQQNQENLSMVTFEHETLKTSV
ncbi:TIGR03032 family protein [Psychrosphaera sp. 1_MG-2023]|uniref:TIGR03032 family protein n=1 Tax=Psychrosphaera sp. 1_MG-2023 TaxID=3062643 RepID=UPI0026E12A8E|nr:TIGR03032 family protein [Psychrosphaera sp. 1_MG-2023]MDO6721340.1 TIGR03032 family protein [Psychrosphaera sp. 1_MG-2023]